jgi:hypothetical protein
MLSSTIKQYHLRIRADCCRGLRFVSKRLGGTDLCHPWCRRTVHIALAQILDGRGHAWITIGIVYSSQMTTDSESSQYRLIASYDGEQNQTTVLLRTLR